MTPVARLAGLTRSWCDFGLKIHLGHSGSDLQCWWMMSPQFGLGLSVKEKEQGSGDDSERHTGIIVRKQEKAMMI